MDKVYPKKVLHVHTLPVISGSGINTFLTMKGTRDYGYESDLACAPTQNEFEKLEEFVKNHDFNFIPIQHFKQPISPINDILALIELYILMKKEKYDVVHTHNSKAGFIGRLAAFLARVPAIIHTVHGFAFHPAEKKVLRYIFIILERLVALITDKMIFISEPMIVWAEKYKIAKKSEAEKIYSCIDLNEFSYEKANGKSIREKYNIPLDASVIGCVSKLWDGKGHSYLIEAFENVFNKAPNSYLMIVGEGYLEEALRKQVSSLACRGNVVFTGFHSDMADVTKSFNISALASDYEGMSRILLEGMAMKKPLVATAVGGMVDLVDDNKNGFLVEPGNAEEIASALLKLVENKELAQEFGENGYKKVTSGEYSIETMVRKIADVYEQVLKTKGLL
ncbi:MAG: glycosyltransferase family 4 protein [Pseudomonadota bacterium]